MSSSAPARTPEVHKDAIAARNVLARIAKRAAAKASPESPTLRSVTLVATELYYG